MAAIAGMLAVKPAAALALFGGTVVVGLLPSWLGIANTFEYSLLLSTVLCFGAGVLMATSIVHILHDAVGVLGVWGQVVFCAGFMLLYFVDELMQFWFLSRLQCEEAQHRHHHHHHPQQSSTRQDDDEEKRPIARQSSLDYGSIAIVQPEFSASGARKKSVSAPDIAPACKNRRPTDASDTSGQGRSGDGRDVVEEEAGGPWEQQVKRQNRRVRKAGLLFAFSIHSYLEGLAVGLQPTDAKVIVLLVAISCHKLVVTFCLGAELMSDTPHSSYIGMLIVYALSSACGVINGTLIQPSEASLIAVLQALAGGSLLYITVGEILPRERHHKNHCPMPKLTGLVQWLAVTIGFIPITLITLYASFG